MRKTSERNMVIYVPKFTVWQIVFILTVSVSTITGQGKMYYFHTQSGNWNSAIAICSGYGGTVLTIGSEDEFQAVEYLADDLGFTAGEYWIGLHYTREENYVWMNCSSPLQLNYNRWAVKSPSEGQCVLRKNNRQWYSSSCNNAKPFVCEKKTGPCTYSTINTFRMLNSGPNLLSSEIASSCSECQELCEQYKGGYSCFYMIYSNTTEECQLLSERPTGPTDPDGIYTGYERMCYSGSVNYNHVPYIVGSEEADTGLCSGRNVDSTPLLNPTASEDKLKTTPYLLTSMTPTRGEDKSKTTALFPLTSMTPTRGEDKSKTTALFPLTSMTPTRGEDKSKTTDFFPLTSLTTPRSDKTTFGLSSQSANGFDSATPEIETGTYSAQVSPAIRVSSTAFRFLDQGKFKTMVKVITTVEHTGSEEPYVTSLKQSIPSEGDAVSTTVAASSANTNISIESLTYTAMTTRKTELNTDTTVLNFPHRSATDPLLHSSVVTDSLSTLPITVKVESGKSCYCPCTHSLSLLEKQQFTTTILQKLILDKKKTAAHVRKLTSAHDPRPSAKIVGCAGLVFLVVAISGIVVFDITTIYSELRTVIRGKRLARQPLQITA